MPDAFTFTLEEGVPTSPPAFQTVTGTVQVTGLHGHRRQRALHREGRHVQFHLERQQVSVALHRPTYGHRFERLTSAGLERVLVRHLRRTGTLTVGLADIVAILYGYGQVVTFTQVPVFLAAATPIRFGPCSAHRWTLLPWERLQVPWTETVRGVMGVPEYVQLATRFWAAHGYVPGPDEEPSARVRALVSRTIGRVPGLPWLMLADDGPIELDVNGSRRRCRVNVQGLLEGKLGNLWIHGTRMDVHTYRHDIVGVDTGGGRHLLTADADEVIVRLIALFQDPAYRARRVELGEHLYRVLRAHRVKLRVNGR